jgi:hypothetical protein
MKQLKFTLVFLLALPLLSVKVNAQTWQTIGNNTSPGDFLGSTSTTNPLELKTTQAQPINFYTNNSATPYVVISTTGDLTVTGNIVSNNSMNLTTSTSAYQIGGQNVLWGSAANLFVGNGNVTIAKNLTVANVTLHNNNTDIDLLKTITELQLQLVELQKRLDDVEKLTAKN